MWVGLAVCVAAVFVQTTRSGLDILALLVAGFALLLIERTLGDWIADTLGSGPAALVFAGIAVAALLYVTSVSGRATAGRFFAAAEGRGYRSAYFTFKDPGRASDVPRLHVAPPAVPDGATSPTPTGSAPVDGVAPQFVAPAPSPAPAPRRAASGVRITRLRSSADVTMVGQPITLRADVTADDAGDLPSVEFTIDGRLIATSAPVGGSADVTWSTRVPGQYVVRARLPGFFGSGNRSTIVTVLPGPGAGTSRRRNID